MHVARVAKWIGCGVLCVVLLTTVSLSLCVVAARSLRLWFDSRNHCLQAHTENVYIYKYINIDILEYTFVWMYF